MARFRLQIDVSAVLLRKLILWAFTKGDKKSSWARTVITLEADENEAKTEAWFEKEARRLGVTKDELENNVLAREGFDFEQYRQEMMGEEE